MDLGHVHFMSASFTAPPPLTLSVSLWLRLSGRQACKLFLLNRCGHKRTCCQLPQRCQCSLPPLAGCRLPFAVCHSWPDPRSISQRAFGNCSLGPAASVLPIVREACAKLLLVVNLLLPLLANLVGHADMQILLLLCVCV